MIGRTFKNLSRLQQIVAAFAGHGFQEIVDAAGLSRFLPKGWKPAPGEEKLSAETRLRIAFDECGPTFVKLGQMLALRSDLIPKAFCDEFLKLQDNVSTIPFDEIRPILEEDLSGALSNLYSEFDEKPIGAASIGQVYQARLRDEGKEVVVKVRRPGITKQIETDISILFTLAGLLEKWVPQLAFIRPVALVEEFQRAMSMELDFANEARNTNRFRKNFEGSDDVVIPAVYWQYSGRRVITMDRLVGTKLKELEQLRQANTDLPAIASKGARAFMKMVFLDGFFHGDLHGGNLFALEGDRIGMIDCGLVGHLDRYVIESIAGMFIALLARDFKRVADRLLEIAPGGSSVDIDRFARDLAKVIEPQMSAESLQGIDTGRLMSDLIDIASRHGIGVPQDLLLLAKSLISLDGMGRQLDPEFNVMQIAGEFGREMAVERYRPERLVPDALMVMRDFGQLGRDLPRQMQHILKRIDSDQFTVNVHLKDKDGRRLSERSTLRLSTALIAAGAIAGAGAAGASSPFGWVCLAVFAISSSALTLSVLKGLVGR